VDKAGYASPSEIRFTYRQNATPTPEPTEAPTPVPTEIPEPDPVVVDVVVNYYGAIDFQTMGEELGQLKIPQIVYDIGNSWMPEDLLQGYDGLESFWARKNLSEMTPEELAVLNPYTYINKNLDESSGPSFWIIHGDCDITVPYLQSEKLYRRLTELMYPENVTYRLVPDMGHASDPLYSDSELALLEQFLDDRMKK
jgi:hypothetical protein